MEKLQIARPTGIQGLDELFKNFWVVPTYPKEGIIILLKGKPGTGKTTLSLQILQRLLNVRIHNKKGEQIPDKILFYSMEQSEDEIENRLKDIYLARINYFYNSIENYWRNFEELSKIPEIKSYWDDFIDQFFSPEEHSDIDSHIQMAIAEKENSGGTNKIEILLNEILKLLSKKLSIPGFKKDTGADSNLAKINFVSAKLAKAKVKRKKILTIESRKGNRDNAYLYNSVMVWINNKINAISYEPKAHKNGENIIPGDPPIPYKLIIIDGLNATTTDERKAFDYESLLNRLKRLSAVSIVVVEPTDTDYSPVENFADIVIDMIVHQVLEPFEYTTNQLIISKARHQFHFKGMHQYSIPSATQLLTVYPSDYFYLASYSVHSKQKSSHGLGPFEMHSFNAPDIVKEGWLGEKDPSLLVKLLGDIRVGSNTIILGPRRTSKTLITLDFIISGLLKESQGSNVENGLIVSLLDNYSAISKSRFCHRNKLSCSNNKSEKYDKDCEKCSNKISLFHLNPEVVSPNIFFYYLRKALDSFALDGKPIKRLTFWDFTQMDITFPMLSSDKLFVSTLFKFLKYYKTPARLQFREDQTITGVTPEDRNEPITSVFFASTTCQLATSSLIADNVIFVWRDKGEFFPIREVSKKPGPVKKTDKLTECLVIYIDRIENTTNTWKIRTY